jgi:hypothetical protein
VFSALGFAIGTALFGVSVSLAFAVPAVRACAAFTMKAITIGLFVGPVVAIARRALVANGPAPKASAIEAEGTAATRARDSVLAGIAIPAATFAFVVVLLEAWTKARSNGSYAGGIVPVSDAAAYLEGAEHLLVQGALNGWNSRRPLNAALLATRIALANGDFRGALLLQAALLGVTTTLAARALTKDFGRIAGFLLFAGLYVFGSIFVATTMSESLGLSLGALSFALLWHAMRTRRMAPLALGFAVCAMALNARSGAFLTLLCLLLWAALTQAEPGTRNRVDTPSLLAALFGTGAGFGINSVIGSLYAGSPGGAHSNFSYTLYGLAKRGAGWEQAIVDFPELRTRGDAEAAAVVYARSLALIRANPVDFVVGLARNVECFVLSMSEKLSLGLLDGRVTAEWVFALAWGSGAAYLVVRAFRVHGADRGLLMVGAATLGVAGSLPAIYMDGRERVFAASVPFLFAGIAIALASLGRGATRATPRTSFEHRTWSMPATSVAAAVIASAVAGPRIAHALFAPKPTAKIAASACPGGLTPMRVFGRHGLPHVSLVSGEPSPLAPHVNANAYKQGIARDVNLGSSPYRSQLAALGLEETLVSTFDIDARRTRLIVLPTSSLAELDVPAVLCGNVSSDPLAPLIRADVFGAAARPFAPMPPSQ